MHEKLIKKMLDIKKEMNVHHDVNKDLLDKCVIQPLKRGVESELTLSYANLYNNLFPLVTKAKRVNSEKRTMYIHEKTEPSILFRTYFIRANDTDNTGNHMHFLENETFTVIQGEVTAKLHPYTPTRYVFNLGEGDVLNVPAGVFHGFTLEKDAILLATSNTPYLPSRGDYFKDLKLYKKKAASITELFDWITTERIKVCAQYGLTHNISTISWN